MLGTNPKLQHYLSMVSPSVNSLNDVTINHSLYQFDQHNDFVDNPWQSVKFFVPAIEEYPGLSLTLEVQDIIDMFPRRNTEFLLERNSKSLVICIGESWIFGETVRTTQPGNDHFCHAMHSTLGARVAHLTNSDLHQNGIPGNGTGLMFQATKKILDYHREHSSYDKIYLLLHITDLNRDLQSWHLEHLRKSGATWRTLIQAKNQKLELTDFFATWEKNYLEDLDTLVNDYKDLNLQTLLFKNITGWYSESEHRASRSFLTVDDFWLDWMAQKQQIRVPQCYFLNAGQMDQNHTIWNYCIRDIDQIEKQIHNIDRYLSIVEQGGPYHFSHPTQLGHLEWSQHICEQAGWL